MLSKAEATVPREQKRGKETSLVINMQEISKSFGNVHALDKVPFTLEAGEIRALVGENGAGKSTLMNILYGMYRPDAGEIEVWGEKVSDSWSPSLAISQGIGMIHQHFSLILCHTVLENIVMPTLKWTSILPRWKVFESKIAELCLKYNFQIGLGCKVETLSMGEKQQVEILKALYQGAKVLILDEPTSVLTSQQTEALLEFLLQLKKQGNSVVIVTHKLTEVMTVSDRITVLRGGKHIKTLETQDASPQKIAKMMIDRDWIAPVENITPPEKREIVLESRGLEVKNDAGEVAVKEVSVKIAAGEIIGVAGVAGNGQIELAEALVGLRSSIKKETIFFNGSDITGWSTGKRRLEGIGYIPEDRHDQGVILEMTLAENMVIDAVGRPPFSRLGIINPQAIDNWADENISAFNIKTESSLTPLSSLSGGNQQKVVLSRTLSLNPQVIVACQPTRGLDFGATEYVRKKLVDAIAGGSGVLLISSDLDEILELSHRIVVMFNGSIVGEFKREDVDIEQLGLLMVGSTGRCEGTETQG